MDHNRIIAEDIVSIVDGIRDQYGMFEGATVLISGGAGFLGKYIVYTLQYLNDSRLRNPCKIIILDNFIVGIKGLFKEGPNLKIIEQDISKPFKIDGNIDYIFHAASIASPKFYKKFPLETIDVGFLGTKNMLEIAREKKVKSFLFFSSSEVYGNPPADMIPTPETYNGNVSCTGARASYDEPKRIGETLCVTYSEVYGVPVKIVRPFNVYGPGMRLDDGRGIVNYVVEGYTKGRIPVYGKGKSTRTWCYITDGIIGFFKVLLSDKNEEAYNVGTDRGEIEMADLAELVATLMENNPEITFMEGPLNVYREADVSRRCADITKMKTRLGFEPQISLVKGLRRFIIWACQELERERKSAAVQANIPEPQEH